MGAYAGGRAWHIRMLSNTNALTEFLPEALGRFLREAVAQPGETRRRGERAAQHARQFFTWAQAGAFAAQRLQALGRALPETATVPAPQAAPAAPVKITLPPAALIGHLAGARDLLRQKKARAAWEAVLAAMSEPVGRVSITCARCGGPATTAPGAITYDCPACWDDIFGY